MRSGADPAAGRTWQRLQNAIDGTTGDVVLFGESAVAEEGGGRRSATTPSAPPSNGAAPDGWMPRCRGGRCAGRHPGDAATATGRRSRIPCRRAACQGGAAPTLTEAIARRDQSSSAPSSSKMTRCSPAHTHSVLHSVKRRCTVCQDAPNVGGTWRQAQPVVATNTIAATTLRSSARRRPPRQCRWNHPLEHLPQLVRHLALTVSETDGWLVQAPSRSNAH